MLHKDKSNSATTNDKILSPEKRQQELKEARDKYIRRQIAQEELKEAEDKYGPDYFSAILAMAQGRKKFSLLGILKSIGKFFPLQMITKIGVK